LKEGRGPVYVVLGVVALGLYGVVASFQPNAEFGRVLAAYGGAFIIGSILWAMGRTTVERVQNPWERSVEQAADEDRGQ